MKIVYAFALIMLALGSCETVEIEKLIYDTVYLEKPQQSLAPSFIVLHDTVEIHTVDTVEVRVVIHETDTVYQVVTKDSIIIQTVEKIVNHTDTVILRDTVVNNTHTVDTIVIVQHDTITVTEYVQRVVYLDTLYQSLYWRTINSIPEELQPFVNDFYNEARLRGINTLGSAMIIQYTHTMAGDGWNSFSYWVGYGEQMVIEVNGSLEAKYLYTPIFRELARLQLGKQYKVTGDEIMNIFFDPKKILIDSNNKEPYLFKLFN